MHPRGDSGAEELYRRLLVPRRIEERMLGLLRKGTISKWFSGIGQEAVAVGATLALEPDDVIFPTHRNLGVFTTRDLDLERLFRQILGRAGGFTKGRDRTFHFGDPDHHVIGYISHLAAMLPVACGAALAFTLRGERRVAVAFCGDGAASEGDFHEAVNLAAVWSLPVVFVIENNSWALSTPIHQQYVADSLAERGVGYGVPADVVDGNDVGVVTDAVAGAADAARRGHGPALIEALTYRMRGHEEASGTAYVPDGELVVWAERDPVADAARDVEHPDEIRAEVDAQISAALEPAIAAPNPHSDAERELDDVFAPAPPPIPAGAQTQARRYIDAISDCLAEEMAADDTVILLGQDVAEYGGAFKVTQGLVETFGPDRVRNTPCIESGALGAALGLALEGFKPIVEMQFADFVSCGFNQIVNNLAKTHYRWGADVNVTVRLPAGGGVGAGPFHSQSPEAWFCHVAGLEVVVPSTPQDAKGLLAAAIADPNPVIYIEHKALYRSETGDVPTGRYTTAIGSARVARTGSAATIVTWGLGVRWALEVADEFDAEVVDLRSLVPWDAVTVLDSVAKTHRALVLYEAPHTSGFGAEVAATIASDGFGHLDAPVRRVASLDTPIPADSILERDVYLPIARLRGALRELVSGGART